MEENLLGWQKLANRQRLASELISVALFNLLFEMLRDAVIDQVKSFYLIDGEDSQFKAEYECQVLSRDKSPLKASLLWLKESGAIDDSDITNIDLVREHRNEVIHEIATRLGSGGETVDQCKFETIISLICKIDRWFICEVEIPTNPDIDPGEVDFDGVMSGRMITVRMILDVLSGSDEYEKALSSFKL